MRSSLDTRSPFCARHAMHNTSLVLVLGVSAAFAVIASPSLAALPGDSSCGSWQTLGPLPLNDPFTPQSDRIVALTTADVGSGPQVFAAVEWSNSHVHPGGARVYRRDGAGWTALGPPMVYEFRGLGAFDTGTGPKLHAWGYVNDTTRGLARWNGSSWESLGAQFDEAIDSAVMFDDGSGPALHVSGGVSMVGSTTVRRFARWNGSSWSEFGGGATSGAKQMLAWDDGNGPGLYVAGILQNLGGVPVSGVARWNGSTWNSLAGGVAGPASGPRSNALAVYDDGSGEALIVGGGFATAGGVPAAGIAKWDGTQWSALGSGVTGLNPVVHSLAVHDAGDGGRPLLYVLGLFTNAGGIPTQGFATWDGEQWSVPPPFPSLNRLSRMSEFRDPLDLDDGPALFVGTDQLSTAALLRGCGQTGELFCFGDASGQSCPCGNSSAVGDRVGCLNSFGTGGSLRGRGTASLSLDALVLDGAQMPDGAALYFQALDRANGGAGVVFGDGLRCTTNVFLRLGTKLPVGGISQYPVAGDASVSVRGGVVAPGTRTYQIRYRNGASFCTSAGFNMTNGLAIEWSL